MKKILIVVLVLILIAVVAYYLFGKKDSTQQKTKNTISALVEKSPFYVPNAESLISYTIKSNQTISSIILGNNEYEVNGSQGIINNLPPGNYPVMAVSSKGQVLKTSPGFFQSQPGKNTLDIIVE